MRRSPDLAQAISWSKKSPIFVMNQRLKFSRKVFLKEKPLTAQIYNKNGKFHF